MKKAIILVSSTVILLTGSLSFAQSKERKEIKNFFLFVKEDSTTKEGNKVYAGECLIIDDYFSEVSRKETDGLKRLGFLSDLKDKRFYEITESCIEDRTRLDRAREEGEQQQRKTLKQNIERLRKEAQEKKTFGQLEEEADKERTEKKRKEWEEEQQENIRKGQEWWEQNKPAIERRRKEQKAKEKKLQEEREAKIRTMPPDIQKLIRNKEIRIGMTKEQVILSWGKSNQINRTVGSWGVHEQWVYEGAKNVYLYFENDILTSYQD